jgi:hypothetical protein
LVKRAAGRRARSGWLEFFLLVVEVLGPWLEKCFETEAEFVEVISDPNERQEARFERKVRRGLRREGVDREFRAGMAERMVADTISEAADAEDAELGACYRELAA